MSSELTRTCKKCNQTKPLTEFWMSDRKRGYLRSSCKDCDRTVARGWYHRSPENAAKANANSRKQALVKPRTPAQQRRYELKNKYGLLDGAYESMLEAQGGCCALCGTTDSGRVGRDGKWAAGHFHVDHCHVKNYVRGLLCHACNTRLGGYERLLELVGEDRLLDYLTAPAKPLPTVLPIAKPPVEDTRPLHPTLYQNPDAPRYTPSPICSIEGCGKVSAAHGLCPTHYRRLQRTGDAGTSAPLPHTSAKGEAHPKSKLTAEQVWVIKASRETGVILAARYGVTPTLISNIRLGRTWAHVGPAN